MTDNAAPTAQTPRPIPENFTLRRGAHKSIEEGACLLEMTAYLAGESHSDSPLCACPVIAAFGRRFNDRLPDDETRTRLLGSFAARLIGTRSTREIEQRRAWIAVDFAIRKMAPIWLALSPELEEHAERLRALPEIRSKEDSEACLSVLREARSAAQRIRDEKYSELRAKPGAAAAAYSAYSAAYAADAAAAYSAYSAYSAADAAADRNRLHEEILEKLRPAREASWVLGVQCLEAMIACTEAS